MPSFVIAQNLDRIGKTVSTVSATLCAPAPFGYPDPSTGVPVKIRQLSERALTIDDKPAPGAVLADTQCNGTRTLLVSGNAVRNSGQGAARARVLSLLEQLRTAIKPLADNSQEPEQVVEGSGCFSVGSRMSAKARAPRSTDGALHDHDAR